MTWTGQDPALAALEAPARARLDAIAPLDIERGQVLFSPGEAVKGYVIMLSGRVGAYLMGPNGRDILLYEVAPGQSCIQSTLGLFGGDDYTAEAVTEADSRLVLLPRSTFFDLLDTSPNFRRVVFSAFANRMQSMMQLVENMSFLRVEERLAALILARATPEGHLEMTQADMARAIGSAREVISRRLDRFTRAGLITHERGQLSIQDRAGLENLVRTPTL
ncbi:MAG TPA: Crp/Fnr family transcriptional regulator [Aliiroseovarius sp.]|nr:Crp/Fnr family transcriptional regulator [Aliiroseovarius sp.]